MHRAQKVIHRRKRGRAFVKEQQRLAVRRGQLPRFRGLRLVRRTRFCSRVQSLDAFLLNVPLLRKLVGTKEFKDVMEQTNPRKRDRQESSLRTWSSDTIYHRATRALHITGPCATLTRVAGMSDFFLARSAWLRCEQSITEAQAKWDFVDRNVQESQATVEERKRALLDALSKRGRAFGTPYHHLAFVLDARKVCGLHEAAAESLPFKQAWQESLAASSRDAISDFWSTEARRDK